MKRHIIYCLLTTMFLTSCVMPESVKLGDQFLLEQSYIEAIQAYQQALTQTTDEESQKQIREKLTQAQKDLTNKYLKKAAIAYQQQQYGIIPAIEDAITILSQAVKWQDEEQRLSTAQQQYKDEITQLAQEVTNKEQKPLN